MHIMVAGHPFEISNFKDWGHGLQFRLGSPFGVDPNRSFRSVKTATRYARKTVRRYLQSRLDQLDEEEDREKTHRKG